MPAISKRRQEYLRSVLLVPAPPRQRETRWRDTLRLLQAQQTFPHDEEVRQGAGDDQSMGVLRQAAVTHLGEPEDAFDHADRMLDLGPPAPATSGDSWPARPGSRPAGGPLCVG